MAILGGAIECVEDGDAAEMNEKAGLKSKEEQRSVSVCAMKGSSTSDVAAEVGMVLFEAFETKLDTVSADIFVRLFERRSQASHFHTNGNSHTWMG